MYASALGQHPENDSGKIYDPIDQKNLYLAVKKNARLVGFIGPTQNYCGGWAEGRPGKKP